jgi:putative spermidine/putrescine transport system substrate-binding protein
MRTLFLRALAIAAVGAIAFGNASLAGKGELRFIGWEGYADDDWVAEFEEKYDADVSVFYIGSNDEMFAKMKASEAQDYDVMTVNTGELQRHIDLGLVKPLDLSRIPNTKNLLPAFQDLATVPGVERDGQPYGVPFSWGSITLIYNKDTVVPAPTSWEVLWDPKYKGRVIIPDSDQQIIQFAVAFGFEDPFNLTKDEMAHIKKRVIDLRSNLKGYYLTFEDSLQYVEDGVDLITQGDEYRIKLLEARGYDNYVLTVPEEGAIGWLDVYTVSTGVGDEDLAYAWINFILEKRISEQLSERLGYPNAVTESGLIDYADKLTWLKAVEDFTWRTNVWNEIKAAPIQ